LGTYHIDPRPVDLLLVARGAVSDLRPLAAAVGAEVEVTVQGVPAGEGGKFIVQGDEKQFYSMLANLLRNALEATPRGGAATVDMGRRGGRIRLEIRNPLPVPEQVRDRLFEKYSSHGKKGGSGLGAYLARLAAEAHGGDIRLETSEGRGTAIIVTLPE
jgi:signal transduction histidine kinase